MSEEYLNYGGKTQHREYADVKMVWRTIDQLGLKEVAPLGIFEHLQKYIELGTVHLKNGFN